jgi:hypothetical protein
MYNLNIKKNSLNRFVKMKNNKWKNKNLKKRKKRKNKNLRKFNQNYKFLKLYPYFFFRNNA